MKLLVHIGTQKTATTSIQRMCVHNRGLLETRGYLYPRNHIHPFLFNFLAEQLAAGDREGVASYLQKIRIQGRHEKCHTVVISAESFYAMSFYYLYPREKSRASEYWQIEARLVEELSQCCAGFDEIEIACYLRPQDDLAAALYNQLVKISPYFSDTYGEFIETVKPMFDYERHIRLWEKYFGADSISIRNFLSGKEDIVEDFFDNFLEPDIYGEADKQESRSNPRLNRDMLEFKRLFNSAKLDPPLAYSGSRFHSRINPEFSDRPGYQIFAAYEFRQNFFGSFSDGNDRLAERHGLGELPVLVNRMEPTYPGLDAEMTFRIFLRLHYLLDQPRVRFKLALSRIVNGIERRFPGGKRLLSPLRTLLIRMKSRI